MKRSRMKSLLPALLAFALNAVPAFGGQDAPRAKPGSNQTAATEVIEVAELIPIVIDPKTNSGQSWIFMRNNSPQERTVTLAVGSFAAACTGRQLTAQATLMKGADAAGGPLLVVEHVKGGTPLAVKVVVSGYTDPGEAVSKVRIDDKDYELWAQFFDVPFNLSLQAATPDKPQLSLSRGADGLITLKNPDTLPYHLKWSLFIPDSSDVLEGTGSLAKSSSMPISFTPKPSWFRYPFEGFFKNDQRDALLTLQFTPNELRSACATPPQSTKPAGQPRLAPGQSSLTAHTLPLQLDLAYWDGEKIWGNLILMLVLLIGAVLSMALNAWIPNYSRRADLLARLNALVKEIRLISQTTDSRLRVITRLQRVRTLVAAMNLRVPRLDAGDLLTQYEQDTDALAKRVEACTAVSEASDMLASFRSHSPAAGPSVLDKAGAALQSAADILSQPHLQDSDIQSAKSLTMGVHQLLADAGKQDLDFATLLASQVADLKQAFDTATGPVGKSSTGKQFAASNAALFKTLNDERYASASTIPVADYGLLDSTLRQLALLREFIVLAEGIQATPSDTEGTRLVTLLTPRLVSELRASSPDAVPRVRCLVTQLRQRVTTEDITNALVKGNFKVVSDPASAWPYEPVRLRFEFNDPRLHNSAARSAFICKWQFDKAIGDETGWEIAHYFRKEAEVKFAVSIADQAGLEIVDSAGKSLSIDTGSPFTLRPPEPSKISDKRKSEYLKVGIAMGIAIIGLIAGAREQFMKLDTFFGLLAVLILGFSADTVKSAFTKRP
jgi:hypothetical protein